MPRYAPKLRGRPPRRVTGSPATIGTAGHIDHGKTWLVRALTGKDTDRLPEERERGISIDLGYAPLVLPDGRRLSLIDVPGHERFVRTMVAGATGIDFFLLVIDAAEGARPQTHEHLTVLRLLGVEHGVVAVTKADTVDEETLALAVKEARELVPEAEVVAVSAKSGAGLDELRAALTRAADSLQQTVTREGATRLFVDRVFSLRGIGTVATGTLWSGRIAAGDRLLALPAARDVRVRSVQVHDETVEVAEAGQRVAVALPGIERHDLQRGDALVEPGTFSPSYRLDLELEELASIPPRALVHHGTSSTLARVVRVGRFAQLRLASPVVAARGDRVVLRAGTTVGGGTVIDPTPPRHAEADRFERVARGEELDAPAEEPAPAPARSEPTLADLEHEAAGVEAQLGLEPVKVADRHLARLMEEDGRLVRVGNGFAISTNAYEQARAALLEEVEREGRITLARFRDTLGTSRKTAQMLLERFDADRVTVRIGEERVLRRSVVR
jgi:selenocysteine-specific elongation factor